MIGTATQNTAHRPLAPQVPPTNRPRMPVTMCLTGMKSETVCSQAGASVMGSKIPLNSYTGRET